MPRLMLVRHGETEQKSSERLWGRTDVKLSRLGLKQAERLRDRLARVKIDTIYSSSMKRALATAEIIASKHNQAVIPCVELREVDFGEIEGLSFAEIDQRFPELAAELRTERKPDFRYPGGESLGELGERVAKFLERLNQHTDGDSILVVAHFGVLRSIIYQLMGMELKHFSRFHLDLASFSILEHYPQGAVLQRLNDVSHLEGLEQPGPSS
jgi:alpha-ribazole phosphatase